MWSSLKRIKITAEFREKVKIMYNCKFAIKKQEGQNSSKQEVE
jgi:hypothetical protein